MAMFVIGSDHGGLELKEAIKTFLQGRGIEVDDYGTQGGDSVDYTDFGVKVAAAVSAGTAQQGILVCGTGIGMSIVANKFPGVRAALVGDKFSARMAKEHNNANIIVLGGRIHSPDKACQLIAAWLDTTFEGGRHQRRLDKIAQIEDDIRGGRL
jgi:ribose 5-phosphate isomerase B